MLQRMTFWGVCALVLEVKGWSTLLSLIVLGIVFQVIEDWQNEGGDK